MKNKFLMFVLAICFVFPFAFFVACGPEEQQPNNNEQQNEQTCSDFIINYNNVEVNFTDGAQIPYNLIQNLSLQSFSIVNVDTQENITPHVQFTLYKIVGDVDTPTTTIEIGQFKAVFSYAGITKQINFSIVPIALDESNVTSNLQQSYPFDANGVFPTPAFYYNYNNTLLVKDIDYTLSYGENNQIGENAGTITLNPIGKYQATPGVIFFFNIDALQPQEVVFNDANLTYTGADQQNSIKLNPANIEGVDSISYTFYDSVNTQVWELRDAGVYRVVASITPTDNYAAQQEKTFYVTINKANIATLSTTAQAQLASIQKEYRGSAFGDNDFVEELQTILGHSQFTIAVAQDSETVDNTNASTLTKKGKFVLTGTQNFEGTLDVEYTIAKAEFGENHVVLINMNDSTPYVYSGSANEIRSVHCYVGQEYIPLTKNTDYTISYTTSNILAGTCWFTITGMGNFDGSYTDSFTIAKQQVEVTEPTWSTTSLTFNGQNQSAAVYISNLDSKFSAAYQTYTTYNEYQNEFVVGTLQNAGSYTVKATVSMSANETDEFNNSYFANYEVLQGIFTTEVTIARANAVADWDGNNTHVYNGSAINPTNIVVTTSYTGQQETLTLNVDYSLTYPQSAVNSDWYYVTVTDLTGNFKFQEGYDTIGLSYYISPKELDFGVNGNATITYPTVNQAVWATSTSRTLNTENAGILDTELNANVPCEFCLVNYGMEISVWLTSNSNYVLPDGFADNDYTIQSSDIVLTNPYFETFTLNGQALSLSEIDNLNEVLWGDRISFTLKDGITMDYSIMTSGSVQILQQQTSFNRCLGVETYEENSEIKRYFDFFATLSIYDNYDPLTNYNAVAGKRIDIVRGAMFNSISISGTTLVPDVGGKETYWGNYNITPFYGSQTYPIIVDLKNSVSTINTVSNYVTCNIFKHEATYENSAWGNVTSSIVTNEIVDNNSNVLLKKPEIYKNGDITTLVWYSVRFVLGNDDNHVISLTQSATHNSLSLQTTNKTCTIPYEQWTQDFYGVVENSDVIVNAGITSQEIADAKTFLNNYVTTYSGTGNKITSYDNLNGVYTIAYDYVPEGQAQIHEEFSFNILMSDEYTNASHFDVVIVETRGASNTNVNYTEPYTIDFSDVNYVTVKVINTASNCEVINIRVIQDPNL